MSAIAPRLLRWFDRHGRKDLPWQGRDAYAVWVSEIMLQQTQVQTVVPYYQAFMDSFPTVTALADAAMDDVLGHWSGLGYYARARNLHKAAAIVRDEYGGELPAEFDAIVALPGIGRSTAGAILALAAGQRHAILDGNVKRVLARHAAIAGWPGKAAVADALWSHAEAQTPQQRVADYTQAMMDLGATVCTRSRPRCDACPLAGDCAALAADAIADYPGRKPARNKPLKQTTMLIALAGDAVYLERRPPSGIWGGLWSLPETADEPGEWVERHFGTCMTRSEERQPLRHSFSHYDLDIRPVVVRLEAGSRRVADSAARRWVRFGEAAPGGMAAPVSRLLNELWKDESECHEP